MLMSQDKASRLLGIRYAALTEAVYRGDLQVTRLSNGRILLDDDALETLKTLKAAGYFSRRPHRRQAAARRFPSSSEPVERVAALAAKSE
jgi:predicted site-specific integrase-resolvase